MFSDKRGAELVLYKLKKTLPIGSGYLPATYRESLYVYQNVYQNVSMAYSATTLTLSADCGLKRSVYVRLLHDGQT